MDHEPERMFRQDAPNVQNTPGFRAILSKGASPRILTKDMRRHLVLPPRGRVLISTDLHGNRDDFEALLARFRSLRSEDHDTHWILAGDLVHGPDEASRRAGHALYGYDDASAVLIREVSDLKKQHPEHVHVLLGNHDHGHIGGPHTSKFFPDEVHALEATLGASEKRALFTLFTEALLAVALPCGALVCHGSPDDTLERLEDLDALSLATGTNDAYGERVLASILRSYGQPEARTENLLSKLSAHLPFPLTFVAHGHDKDELGIFWEGKNQVCPVLFGAYRAERRCLVLDLSTHYADARALRQDFEVLRVHGLATHEAPPPSEDAPRARRNR
jgi:hypothetical protein